MTQQGFKTYIFKEISQYFLTQELERQALEILYSKNILIPRILILILIYIPTISNIFLSFL